MSEQTQQVGLRLGGKDDLIQKQFEAKKAAEAAERDKEAKKIMDLAKGQWGFGEADYDEGSSRVVLKNGGATISLALKSDENTRLRRFGISFADTNAKDGAEVRARLANSGLSVRELTEIGRFSSISEVRPAIGIDPKRKGMFGEVLTLAIDETERGWRPDSWQIFPSGQITTADKFPANLRDVKRTDYFRRQL